MITKSILTALIILGASHISWTQDKDISWKNLSKKWYFEKYTFLGMTERPSSKEKDDYLFLRRDSTFSCVSEGIYETGKWNFDAINHCILLYKTDKSDVLPFIIAAREPHKLILYIYDPDNKKSKHLKLHFKK